MRLRRALCFLLAAATPLVACQLVVGIEDDRFTVAPPVIPPDPASDASSEEAAVLPDLCAHRGPPARPDGGAGGDGQKFILAVDSYVLDDVNSGFDLDGICTCDPLDRSQGAGRATCGSPTNDALCDGDGGVDNRLAATLAPLGGIVDVSAIFNRQVACGRETLLVVLSNYNGEANDLDVKVSVIEAFGIPDDDGGASANAGCAVQGEPPTLPPRRDGNDSWDVPPGATTPGARTEISGWVTDFHLVVDARRSTSTVPFYFGGTLVTLSGFVMSGKLVPLGVVDGGPAFRLREATLAGRAPARQVAIGAGQLNLGGGYLCDVPNWSSLKAAICDATDTVHNIGLDLTGQPCDAVSVGVRFEAIPALLGTERSRVKTTPCGSNWEMQNCP